MILRSIGNDRSLLNAVFRDLL